MHERGTDHAPSSPSDGTDRSALELPEHGAELVTLDNGLEILVRSDRSVPVVSLQAWVKTGSLCEGERLGSGASHFVEHMLFKGTEKRHYSLLAQEVEAAGGNMNAYTTFDRTVYWMDCPSDGAAACLDVLCDMVGFSNFPEDEFEKEQDVIRREIAMGLDDPGRRLCTLLYTTSYSEHPSRLPVIGHREPFGKLTRDDLYAYYEERYTPNNMFFVVAGDVEVSEIVAQIEASLGSLPRRAEPAPYIPSEPVQVAPRVRRATFDIPTSRVSAAWHIPNALHADIPALDLLAGVLGDGRSSRLCRELRDGQELALGTYANAHASSYGGLFMAGGETEPDKRDVFMDELLQMIETVRSEGVTEAELAKARNSVLSTFFEELASMRGVASEIALGWMMARDPGLAQRYVALLSSVTPEDVLRVAQQYLVEERRTVISLDPEGAEVLSAPDVFVRTSGEMERRELPNGMPLIVQRDSRVPLVAATAVFRGGTAGEVGGGEGVARLTMRALHSGAAGKSAGDLASEIEDVGGYVSGTSGNNSLLLTAETMAPDLGTGLGAMADLLIRPDFPEAGIGVERDSLLARVRSELARPAGIGMRELRTKMFAGHPLAAPVVGNEDGLNGASIDDLRAYRERYLVAANGTLAIFGDIEADQAHDLAAAALADLPVGERQLDPLPAWEAPEPSAEAGGGGATSVELDREQAFVAVGYYTGGLADPDRRAMGLLEEATGDMSSALFTKIREELGLAYSVGTFQVVGYEQGGFVFYVSTAPDKVVQVREVLDEEIARLAAGGLAEDEFDRAKKGAIGRFQMSRQEILGCAQEAALDEIYGYGFDHQLSTPKEIEAVSRGDVAELAKRLFTDSPAASVVVNGE